MADRVSPARRAAFEVLRRVFEHEAWADRALPAAVRRQGAEGQERALAQRLAYGSVQRAGTADHLIERLAERSTDQLDPPVIAALRLGLYELLYTGGADHAAVDQAVELAKGAPGGRRGAGLVNAVLRRAAGERESLLQGMDDTTPDGAAIRHSHPPWLAELWWRELGPERARALMAAGNEPMETALRVNTLRAEPAEVLRGLRAENVAADAAAGPAPLDLPESLVIGGPFDVAGSRQFRDGELTPQSRASAAAAALLNPGPGERVLDLCAGPGIKTTHLAARMGDRGEIVSVDRDPGRARQIGDTCARLGVSCVSVIEADAASEDLGEGFDRVLVDPPCSDLGTLASRPDARWRKSPELIERLANLQDRVLRRAAKALRPGGVLLYSTCTISRAENQAQVETLLAATELSADDLGSEYPDLAGPDPRFLQSLPDRDGTEGLFFARLRRG